MFEVGFSELLMLGLISLLVIGPERLPKAARFVGFWLGRSRAVLNSLKTEFEREIHAEELRQILKEQSSLVEMQAFSNELTEIKHAIEVETAADDLYHYSKKQALAQDTKPSEQSLTHSENPAQASSAVPSPANPTNE